MRDFRLAFRMMREVYKVANILVCDDDKDIVEAIGIYLEQEGYTVIKAYDGVPFILLYTPRYLILEYTPFFRRLTLLAYICEPDRSFDWNSPPFLNKKNSFIDSRW